MECDGGGGLHHVHFYLHLTSCLELLHVHHQLQVIMDRDNLTRKPVFIWCEKIRTSTRQMENDTKYWKKQATSCRPHIQVSRCNDFLKIVSHGTIEKLRPLYFQHNRAIVSLTVQYQSTEWGVNKYLDRLMIYFLQTVYASNNEYHDCTRSYRFHSNTALKSNQQNE